MIQNLNPRWILLIKSKLLNRYFKNLAKKYIQFMRLCLWFRLLLFRLSIATISSLVFWISWQNNLVKLVNLLNKNHLPIVNRNIQFLMFKLNFLIEANRIPKTDYGVEGILDNDIDALYARLLFYTWWMNDLMIFWTLLYWFIF